MARNIQKFASKLGARAVSKVADVGGGAFGAARLAEIMKLRLMPSSGKRSGRPSNPAWKERPKVPMSKETLLQLRMLARHASTKGRKVSAMQVAAQLLEDSVGRLQASMNR